MWPAWKQLHHLQTLTSATDGCLYVAMEMANTWLQRCHSMQPSGHVAGILMGGNVKRSRSGGQSTMDRRTDGRTEAAVVGWNAAHCCVSSQRRVMYAAWLVSSTSDVIETRSAFMQRPRKFTPWPKLILSSLSTVDEVSSSKTEI